MNESVKLQQILLKYPPLEVADHLNRRTLTWMELRGSEDVTERHSQRWYR